VVYNDIEIRKDLKETEGLTMTKLYNRKTQETQIVENADEAFISMTIKLWVRIHNERNPENRISKKDILVID
jgi:hypothetical protein